jgi:two-component system, LuxR family, sensor kinase FixL
MTQESTLPTAVGRPFLDDGLLAALDATPAMVRGLDGTVMSWTSGAARLYGWAPTDAVGRSAHELLRTAFPQPREAIKAELLAAGHWHGELTRRTRAGTTVRVAAHWVLQTDAAGQPVWVIEIGTDITAHSQADSEMRRLAAIVESSSDAIVGKDLDGIVTSWNRAAEAMFGYPAEEMLGRPIVVLFPPDRVDEEIAIIDRVRRGDSVEHYDTVRQRKDGTQIPVSVSVAPIRDESGRVSGASKIVRDLSERQEQERHLREVQAQLFHAQRLTELGQLVSTLVHEINQPLTAIGNYTSASRRLLGANNPQAAGIALDKIAEQAERAHQIIQRLRNFVRGGEANRRAEDLGAVINEAVALAASSLTASGVRLRTRFDSSASLVSADRVQIQQVLFNLVRNAAEAMQDAPRRELLIATTSDGNEHIEVSVADTGPGLPAETRAHLFEPFFTTKGNGMGIGLSVCRSIVLAHGGRLWAEDNPAGGTVFRFTLPRAQAENAVASPR